MNSIKKICVFGPESTGKSTLTENLAKHFSVDFVSEYARDFIEDRNGDIKFEDMLLIAKGQAASQVQKERETNHPFLFFDTDPLATIIWSNELFGECDPEVEKIAKEHFSDLYLLTDVDVPWVDDIVRYLPENRRDFFEKCKSTLEKYNLNYRIISGEWLERLDKAIKATNNLVI